MVGYRLWQIQDYMMEQLNKLQAISTAAQFTIAFSLLSWSIMILYLPREVTFPWALSLDQYDL